MTAVEPVAGATYLVTDEALASAADPAAMKKLIIRELIARIEQHLHEHAYAIPPLTRDDVIVTTTNHPSRHATHIEAVHHPDPTKGIEFHGGPYDGEARAVQRVNGEAPTTITIETIADTAASWTNDPFPSVATIHVAYERTRINPHTGRWIYTTPTRHP